ncbi:MAG: prepilin-type N-terminal cleavage/methylation domain-containing protein [Deltaproteobacteria bacterium]|nr:prepilin-type N-terminal cleavage/methylation domain-containing protein [Deltaproteobacteria bacterium]MBW2389103.1 prepilin-type N-terminal cleavage/methylation domain-containing protein [Deltaproteobacteria bacterium]
MQFHERRRTAGFTLIELMIVVSIVGLLSSVAIPNYMRFQMKTKSTEAKTSLAAIRTAEESYFSEYGRYAPATPNPVEIPGSSKTTFSPANVGFQRLGFSPEGTVYFSYAVAVPVAANASGFSADAGADLDSNGIYQYWAFVKESSDGTRTPALVGCDVTGVVLEEVTPCTPQSGQSVF